MSKFLFLCSIGPVQEFIATARRSRDLWFGSWLLSELSKSVAKACLDCGGELVFPCPKDPANDLSPDSKFNSPNRVSAIFDDFDRTKAKDIQKAMEDRLDQLWREVKQHIQTTLKASSCANALYTEDLADEQVKKMTEFYWVAVAFNETDDYPTVRDKAEAYLAARKNTREFEPNRGLNRPKSSLDGMRESVIPEKYYQKNTANPKELYDVYRARGAERLSGVDLLKRLGRLEDENKFPSTSDLAAAPLLAQIKKEPDKKEELFKRLKELIKEGYPKVEPNGSLLFEARIAEFVDDPKKLPEVLCEHKEILKEYFGGLAYCLFIADGDNMGKIIDEQKNVNDHRDLSRKISEFAETVPDIIKSSHGTCIYAGGEDILAYLPLHEALKCAEVLNEKFSNHMSQYKSNNASCTLSGGLVIAHHLTPLHEVIKLAHEAERISKSRDGKNGLTVVLSKRSGVDTMISDQWGNIVERLLLLTEWINQDDIGQGMAHELKQLEQDFASFPQDTKAEAIAKEAIRILNRKNKPTVEVNDTIKDWIIEKNIPVSELAKEIIVANQFARAIKLANP